MRPRAGRVRRPIARPGPARALAAVAVAVSATTACGASEPTSTEAAATDVADAVCTTLRAWNNEMGDGLNATSASITDDDDPDTANAVLLEGFDELIAMAEAHRAEIDALDLAVVHDRDALLAELAAGADAAIELLEDERDDIAELAPITVDRQAGALGGAFVALEGALSVIEPQVGGYHAELRDAFVRDEGCRHVIQPTGDPEARP